ncbi:MAG TPA: glycoside hydrolase family 57, partial [Verrucomicrobiae bacterium]|nr:glycoside hydrolase family 57 [Verrucomicrobiae bacterium]
EVRVQTGAWNTGWHNGSGFTQWTGSQMQKDALQRVAETSRAFHAKEPSAAADPAKKQRLGEAQWRLLRSETSCNFFWGEAWTSRCHADLDEVWNILNHLDG